MSPDGFVPGYLVYLLEIFLPGIGFGELLNLWHSGENLAERAALSFALGLSVVTIIFSVKTSGIAGLVGIGIYTVYFTIGLGLAALVASAIIKKRITFPVKPTRIDIVLFVIIFLQGIMLLLYFQKYPIFPEYFTQDPTVHVNYVEGLISGTIKSIPSGLLYFGVHYQLASGVLLVGGEPLVVLQRVMAILVTISPLLFFTAAKKLFSSERAAVLITAIYTFSGMVWFAGVFDSGLYPNFFGILAALFLIISVVKLTEKSSIYSWSVFVIALFNGYMSHYTFVTLLPALIIIPLFRLSIVRNFKDQLIRRYSVVAVVSLAPAAIPFVLYPNLASKIISLATSGGGVQATSTYLSNAFASFPVLSFLAVEMEDDVALIVCLLLVAFFIYRLVTTKDALFTLPLVWFVALFIAAPFNISAWRFSYEGLVPLTFMAGFALYSILPASFRDDARRQSQKKGTMSARIRQRGQSQLLSLAIFVIFLGALVIGSWGQAMLGDALTDSAQEAQSQNNVYQAIYWLKENTPNGSQYLAVSDWRFTYSNLMTGRLTHYEYIFNVTDALNVARNTSSEYILVTNIVTSNLPSIPAFYPWNTFPTASDANLTLIYSNPDVRIYQLA